jgi:hypothetical protein
MILVEDACYCFELPGLSGNMISARAIHEAHVATLGFEFCKVVTTAVVVQLEFIHLTPDQKHSAFPKRCD